MIIPWSALESFRSKPYTYLVYAGHPRRTMKFHRFADQALTSERSYLPAN